MLVKNLNTGAVWAVNDARAAQLLQTKEYEAVPHIKDEKVEAVKPSRSRTKPKAESGE